jgi:hypothetical protein
MMVKKIKQKNIISTILLFVVVVVVVGKRLKNPHVKSTQHQHLNHCKAYFLLEIKLTLSRESRCMKCGSLSESVLVSDRALNQPKKPPTACILTNIKTSHYHH